jgi:hypothetical protein
VVSSRGAVYNGSHSWIYGILRDCLYSPRGRMRVSVYKEPGVNYLTRTEGLRLALADRSGVVLADLPVMYAYGAN